MKELLWFFIQLALLREKPQSLPDSLWLLKALLLLYLLLGMPLAVQMYGGPGQGLAGLVLELVASGLLLMGILQARQRMGQWRRAYTAWLGLGILATLLSYGSVLLVTSALASLRPLLELLVFFWSILAMAHVLRHSAGISLPFALLIVFFYAMIMLSVIAQWVVPAEMLQAPVD